MPKTRLTITLAESTLKKVDQLIDKKNIRNRSHAIEHLIEKSLQASISTAIILAGGSQKKDQEFRPMISIDQKPLILYTIKQLKKYGVKKIIIATNQKGDQIEKLIGNGQKLGIRIYYSYENQALGTAGAIRNAQSRLGQGPFYVIAGDILTNINLSDLANFHFANKALATMAVKPRTSQDAYDNVFIQGHTVVDFQKRKKGQVVSIVNAGIYIFEQEVLEHIPKDKKSNLEADIFPRLSQSGRLLAFPFQGIWFDVGSDSSYKKAVSKLKGKS